MPDPNDISRPDTAPSLSGGPRPFKPHEPARRLLLRTVRSMTIGGINDANAAALLLGRFGRAYRRPLVLTRALVLELARTSNRRITLAPPCCSRITRDEAVMLRALARPESEFAACHQDVCRLLGRNDALAATTCFQAVASCFADLGAPFV